jgi:arylsulfatase A-like enzyme/cytochrome c-type biogenesis protein CcmH/NrfG
MRPVLAAWVAALWLCFGCADPGVPPGSPIVLISIDTLRADRLPVYGYGGVETAAIDALARDGIVFERAYTHAPTTLPAHASLFTGLLPPAHGVRDNAGYRLDRSSPTLAEELQKAGYATGAAVSSFVLRRSTGLDRGFDFYEDGIEFTTRTGLGGLQRPGDETLRAALEWLGTVEGQPWFLFFHLFEPHAPYAPPEPFASNYGDAYDGEVAAADRIVGQLIAELKRRNLYDRAVVLLLSDHGEGLNDHGEQEHGVLLYRESLHVPLILKLPHSGSAGARVSTPAQLIDLLPTLLPFAGRRVPDGLAGLSLLDLLARDPGERAIYSETFYPRLHFGWSELASLVSGRFHYIEGPDPELYDLLQDPAETRNLTPAEPETVIALRARLESIDRSLRAPDPVDDETRARLASLGYLGGSVADPGETLPDPKQRVHRLEELRSAQASFARGDHAGSAAAFRRLVGAEPRLLDAWDYLARSLQALGRYDEALAAYEDAIRLTGGPTLLSLSAAHLLFSTGRLEQAAAHAELAREADPAEAAALLAQIARRQGNLERARELAREAVSLNDTRFGPLLTMADVLLARREFEEAMSWLERVETGYASRRHRDPQLIRGLYFLRGQILANLGEAEQAEQAFRREIELFPRESRAYSHLAVLYGLVGRGEEAAETLQSMVRARPVATAYVEAVKTARLLGDEPTARELLVVGRARFPDSPALAALD